MHLPRKTRWDKKNSLAKCTARAAAEGNTAVYLTQIQVSAFKGVRWNRNPPSIAASGTQRMGLSTGMPLSVAAFVANETCSGKDVEAS